MKRFVSFLVCLMMLTTVSYAKIDEKTIVSEDVFTYKGNATANANVSITILKPSKTLEELESADDKLSVLAGYKEVKADSTGAFEVDFNLGDESGFYAVYMGAQGSSKLAQEQIHYVNSIKNETAFATLKTMISEKQPGIETFINDNWEDLGIDSILFNMTDADNIEEMAKILYKGVDDNDMSNAKAASVILDKALLVSLHNGGVLDAFGEYIDIFVTDETLAQWCEKSFITDSTKEFMNGKVTRDAESFEEFDNSLIEAVALGVIRDADGYGNIKEYLNDFSEELGIDEKYITNAFASSIIGKTFDSIKDTDYDDFEEKKDDKKPSKGGGGFGGVGVQIPETPKPEALPSTDVVVDETTNFEDLEGYEWAKEAIDNLYDAKIINGRAQGVYAPGESVLREEFVKMILLAGEFGEIYGSINFSDVPEDAWFYEYVRNAFSCGIINGISDDLFGSGNNITRQDMAVICYNTLSSKGMISADSIAAENKADYADRNEISDYALSAVEYLTSIGILKGNENNMFNPKAGLTRAEAAVAIYRVYSLIKSAEV